MKAVSNNSEFWKIFSLGCVNNEFSLHLSEQECNYLNIDIKNINSVNEIYHLLSKEEIKGRIKYDPNNGINNLLLYLNKTNNNKTFIEHLSLTTINNDYPILKEIIKNDLEYNFIFLLESNLVPKCKFSLNLNSEGCEPKLIEFDNFPQNRNLPLKMNENDNKLSLIKVEFSTYDYIVVDLNEFLSLKNFISLENLLEFLVMKLSLNVNTHVILISQIMI